MTRPRHWPTTIDRRGNPAGPVVPNHGQQWTGSRAGSCVDSLLTEPKGAGWHYPAEMGTYMGDLFAPWHIVILVVAFMVLFGARKLPGAAQSLGQAMRIFKSETKGLINDDEEKSSSAPNDARTEAARLREQAARLEAQAGPQELNAPQGGEGTTVNGVPLQQTEHGKHS
jgi:sec-independent protein translocase protein TatA